MARFSRIMTRQGKRLGFGLSVAALVIQLFLPFLLAATIRLMSPLDAEAMCRVDTGSPSQPVKHHTVHATCAICQTLASALPLLAPGKAPPFTPDVSGTTIRLFAQNTTSSESAGAASYESRAPPLAA